MASIDAFWIDKCIELPGQYTIVVDNDEIYVFDKNESSEVHTFSEYGWRFALGLLRHIGCDAEEA